MNSLRILYIAVHEILEFDDLKMFTSRGHNVFSLGRFMDPATGPYSFRQPLPAFFQDGLLAKYKEHGITSKFLDDFDVILVNHDVNWLIQHLPLLRGRFVVYRTIGQSAPWLEDIVKNLDLDFKIVRYSSKEVGLPGFAHTDEVIYFGKDLADYQPWRGGSTIITFHNNFFQRAQDSMPSPAMYKRLVEALPATLFGQGNEGFVNSGGLLSFDEMKHAYRSCGCYFYVWTTPPSYTLSVVEAMLTGVPIVAPSVTFLADMDSKVEKGWCPERYEIDDFLDETPSLLFDTEEDASAKLRSALDCSSDVYDAAQRIRTRAQGIFDAAEIGAQWDAFFRKNHGLEQ